MEYLYLFGVLFLLNFLWSWIKVKFFMVTLSIKGNSFLYTILYIFGKQEIKDLLASKQN